LGPYENPRKYCKYLGIPPLIVGSLLSLAAPNLISSHLSPFLSNLKMQRILSRAASAGGRLRRCTAALSTDVPAVATEESTFVEAWSKVAPSIDPPKTPLAFMKPRPPTPSSIPTKLTVNFVLPHKSEISNKEVDMVIVPATTGQMGVLPGHVSTIAELKPGLLSVHEGSDVTKYFVSSGFAFVHANSVADIVAVEAVPLDNIDLNLVQKGLADFTQKVSSASTDLEKAEAQIGLDVHSALNAALTG
jgi:F-type H+-transporting ATPase subunit delta